jgi:dolichol-phosphate mannosyltransferase
MAGRERQEVQILADRVVMPDRPEPRRLLPSLSLVIPAFNEAAVIRQAIAEAEDVLAAGFANFEIIVVDDGSTDETAAIVEQELTAAPHTWLVRHAANRGYGAALRTGFEAARHDLVAFTDADCQFDLADLKRLAARTDEYPIVAGYRAERKDSRRRRFFSWGYNRLVRTLLGTGVRDCDCAIKVYRREAIRSLLPESRGFFVNAEMLTRARQKGLAVLEMPVAHRPRLGGESKVSLREVPGTLRTLLGFWWRTVWSPPPAPVKVLQVPLRGSGAAAPRASAPALSIPLPPVTRSARDRGAA